MDVRFFFQKRQKDDQKPLEEKIKTLKKRNAELAAIARRLEEKAKHLQQENMKVAILLLFGRGCIGNWNWLANTFLSGESLSFTTF